MRPRLACPGCDAARALASGASLIRDRHRRGALFSPVVYRKAGAFVARMSAGEIRGIPRLASLMRATRFACGRSRLHCYSLILTMENTNPGVRAVRVRPARAAAVQRAARSPGVSTRGTEQGVRSSKNGVGRASPRTHQPSSFDARRTKIPNDVGGGAVGGSGPTAERS